MPPELSPTIDVLEGGFTNRTYTTGEATDLVPCSQQYVIKAFDQKILKGHRFPTSKGFRRIDSRSLQEWSKQLGMENALSMQYITDYIFIVVAQLESETRKELMMHLGALLNKVHDKTRILLPPNTFEAGILAHGMHTESLLIDESTHSSSPSDLKMKIIFTNGIADIRQKILEEFHRCKLSGDLPPLHPRKPRKDAAADEQKEATDLWRKTA